jgi:endoglucanase
MSGRAEAAPRPAPSSRFALPRRHRGVLAQADRERLLDVVRALLTVPTAPYFEDGVLAAAEALCARIPGIELRREAHGNLLALWRGRRRGARTLAFSAHLDHPGFHVLPGRAPRAQLHGGLPERFLAGAPLRLHAARTLQTVATARVARARKEDDGRVVAELADVRGALRRGAFGVFDLPDGIVRGARLHARVCDDLLGAAAALVALEILAREGHERPLGCVLTRAEETGFVGCIGLLRARALPRDTAVIGLECSPRRATARVGRGPVVRVGDKLSVFEPELTHGLQAAAARLAERHRAFVAQRALMDGGSCESTAYNAFGVPAGGACLALGNYHNCGPDGRVAAEFVDWDDLEGLVALLVELARGFDAGGAAAGIRARLLRNWARESQRLRDSARRLSRARVRRRGARR